MWKAPSAQVCESERGDEPDEKRACCGDFQLSGPLKDARDPQLFMASYNRDQEKMRLVLRQFGCKKNGFKQTNKLLKNHVTDLSYHTADSPHIHVFPVFLIGVSCFAIEAVRRSIIKRLLGDELLAA